MPDIPSTSWDESAPIGTQPKSLGATRIRELKSQIREILINSSHVMESSGNGSTWGYHRLATFYKQISNPVPVTNAGILFSKIPTGSTTPELYWIDEVGHNMQLTSNGWWVGGLIGEIRAWMGTIANIPGGWSLCDGLNGRPNLIAKFIRGINTNITEPLGTGGLNSITLSIENLPSDHIHTTATDGMHYHIIAIKNIDGSSTLTNSWYKSNPGDSGYGLENLVYGDGAHTHTTTATGNNIAFDNRPAYYEVAYMIKT